MDLGITSWRRRIFDLKSEALWVVLGQLGTALGVVLGVKILTQVLDPAEYGRMALANTVVLLVGSNIFGPIGQGFMRFWSICRDRAQDNEFLLITDRFAGRLLLFTVGLSLILFVISASTGWPRWIVLMTLSLIAGGVTGYFGLRLSVFLAARNRKIVALVNTGNAILKPVIALFFVIALFNNADCVILGYVITAFLAAFLVEHLYKKIFCSASFDPSVGRQKETGIDAATGLGKEILAFSWPFYIWGMVGWVHQSCDRWSPSSVPWHRCGGCFFGHLRSGGIPPDFWRQFIEQPLCPNRVSAGRQFGLSGIGSIGQWDALFNDRTLHCLGSWDRFLFCFFSLQNCPSHEQFQICDIFGPTARPGFCLGAFFTWARSFQVLASWRNGPNNIFFPYLSPLLLPLSLPFFCQSITDLKAWCGAWEFPDLFTPHGLCVLEFD